MIILRMLLLRCWIPGLARRLSKRRKLRYKLSSEGVVKKTKGLDGKVRVLGSQLLRIFGFNL